VIIWGANIRRNSTKRFLKQALKTLVTGKKKKGPKFKQGGAS
jgi:hypothetical protein